MVVGDTVAIGNRTFEIEVIMPIERQLLLKYKNELGLMKIYGWVSFDEVEFTNNLHTIQQNPSQISKCDSGSGHH